MPAPELIIPNVPWATIRRRMQQTWTARDAPHHSIMGQTRSGKSFLTRHGILSVCEYDRVLFIDGKGDDPTINGLGRVVRHYPSKLMRAQTQIQRDDMKRANWFRLVTDIDREKAKEQVDTALRRVIREGDWVVVFDEVRYITDARDPGLGLRSLWEAIILRGGSRGIAAISLTQEPRWVPSSFYTQPSFVWISRVEDEIAQKRIAEIGSSRGLMQHLPTIRRRNWIYTDALDEDRFWGYTSVNAR